MKKIISFLIIVIIYSLGLFLGYKNVDILGMSGIFITSFLLFLITLRLIIKDKIFKDGWWDILIISLALMAILIFVYYIELPLLNKFIK